MREYKVQVWIRKVPLIGSPERISGFRSHEVRLDATSAQEALERVHSSEHHAGGKRLRVYVQTEDVNGLQGLGDLTLMKLVELMDEVRKTLRR